MAFAMCVPTVLDKRRSLPRRSAGRDVNESWRKALLICGIVSSLLYGAMIGAIRFEGYSRISQVSQRADGDRRSDAIAVDALGAVYTVLVTAFGWGVWKSAGRSRAAASRRGLDVGLRFPWPPLAVCRDAPT